MLTLVHGLGEFGVALMLGYTIQQRVLMRNLAIVADRIDRSSRLGSCESPIGTNSRPGRIKLLHTTIWFFFAGCIVAIPIAGACRQFRWTAALSGIVLVECAVLAMNRGRCPLTDLAGRYPDDRRDNFDIYLPLWLARHNKTIFGTLFAIGELIVLGRWLMVVDTEVRPRYKEWLNLVCWRSAMLSRREFIRGAALCTALPGFALTNAACATADRYGDTMHALRSPLLESLEHGALLRELVRCATLAPNGHNAQPWKFGLSPDAISIRPDLSRRTPVVDPDEHHLWVSLGCAAENLVLAAGALGKHADVAFDPQKVHVALDNAAPVRSPLVNAIFQRQSTRAEYDGQPMPNNVLQELSRAADRGGVRILLLTERTKVEGVLDSVTQGNSAQIRNPAFVKELKSWIRFNEADALSTGDGLFSRLTGNPTLPHWLGEVAFSMVLSEKSENDKYAKQLRSSAGVAVFVGERADPANWFEVGRAYEHFALAATALGVRTALVNQPVEVPAVRTQFAQWLGLGSQRPDLVVRFGHGPEMPYSLRRPVADVIV